MCGIFALLNLDQNGQRRQNVNDTIIEEQFMKGVGRGPEFSKLVKCFDRSDSSDIKLLLGFHRLAINGLNEESNQPLTIDNITLVCNGEIYNYKKLYDYMGVKNTTDSDCEVIIHLYKKYGIEQTLTMLDGVYAFILLDNRCEDKSDAMVYIARDPMGVRPLYKLMSNTKCEFGNLLGFASELKCLEYFNNLDNKNFKIDQFEPGTYSILQFDKTNNNVFEIDFLWKYNILNKLFYLPIFSHTRMFQNSDYNNEFYPKISEYLDVAVKKRCTTTDRPVACLLSGGLDSSLIAALVANHFHKNNNMDIETYSIGLKNSEDIKYAKIVADYIGSKHTEIIVTEQEMFDAIPEVIKAIESYDTTTVRASIGNYLLGKYISSHSDAKVIFNGDGSDELFGGYLYMNKCPDDIEFDKETRRLLRDIHMFDVLRSDKSISSHGLEPRTPFLDRSFVNYILSIPIYFRNHNNFNSPEKYLLRESFQDSYFVDYLNRQILPNSILFRKKEAFSDGVSSHGRSLYEILQEKIFIHLRSQKNFIFESNELLNIKPCLDTEKAYYLQLFDSFYPNCTHLLPYYWMPRYTDATDPSARTLSFYNADKRM
jgi:asparagine synthase (glutamine-hydrolysing)